MNSLGKKIAYYRKERGLSSLVSIQNDSLDISGLFMIIYIIGFLGTILYLNYIAIDAIYVHEVDCKRAKMSWWQSLRYTMLILVGVMMVTVIFKIHHIENNTLPALKIGTVFLVGILIATISFLVEQYKIKKRDIFYGKVEHYLLNHNNNRLYSDAVCLEESDF